MRTSKRDRIITGALELAHRDGFDALTFDALAEQVGLTRGGVIYHFRTKTELLEGIAVAFQERWRAEALEALGKPLEEANRTERIEALARSVLDGEILPGEVSFILSSTPQAETIKNAWDMLRDEWIGEVDELSAMRSGSILAQGTPSDVVTEETVREVFGISSKVVPDPVSGAPLVMPIGRHRVKRE